MAILLMPSPYILLRRRRHRVPIVITPRLRIRLAIIWLGHASTPHMEVECIIGESRSASNLVYALSIHRKAYAFRLMLRTNTNIMLATFGYLIPKRVSAGRRERMC